MIDAHGLGGWPEDVLLKVSVIWRISILAREEKLVISLGADKGPQFSGEPAHLAHTLGCLSFRVVDVAAVPPATDLDRLGRGVDVARLQTEHLRHPDSRNHGGERHQLCLCGATNSRFGDRREK